MFILSTIHDTIKVRAPQLGLETASAIENNINAKYANRVLPGVGLCVAHFDFVSISEGHIRFGDGATYYKTAFRLVVFRPFKGEVLLGKIKGCDETGIRITLGFFDDIHVSWEALPAPCGYDRGEATWFWVSEASSEVFDDPLLSNKDERFYFDRHEYVRFTVEDYEFNEPEPPRPRGGAAGAIAGSNKAPGEAASADPTDAKSTNRVPLFKIHASMAATGLGPLSWWKQYEEQGAPYTNGDTELAEE